ncbi:MAG: hypothetical protein KC478_01965 [Bacteriovoracaceae bacterium]|nr:hypothetical protein [Bacteriovoracaceae bacterium]
MNKKLKVAVVILLVLIVGVASVFYIVSTKIDPEVIKAKTIEALEDALPGADASIGNISYSLGFAVDLNVSKLELVDKKSKKKLFSVEQVMVDIPILSILSNGGTVDVKVVAPELVYEKLKDGSNNWEKVLPAPKPVKKEENVGKAKDKEEKGSIEIPSFIEQSKIDIKISNLKLNYLVPGAKQTDILVNKILLKNLNLKKTTAFEVVSSVQYGLEEEKTVNANIQLVGEVSLNKLIKSGAVDMNMMLNVENISLSWLDIKVPNLKNVMRFSLTSSKEVSGELRTEAGNLFNLETDFHLNNTYTDINISNLSLTAYLANLAKLAPSEAVEGINFDSSKLNLKGSTKINLENEVFNPSLAFSMDRPIELSVSGKNISTIVDGRFEGEDLFFKVKNELFSGVATIDARTKLNPLKLPDSLSSYPQIKSKLLITNLKLEKPFIQKLLYTPSVEEEKKVEDTQQAAGTPSVEVESAPIEFPPFVVQLEGKHIFIENQEMNIAGQIIGKNQEVKTPKFKLTYGSGVVLIDSKTKLKTSKDITSSFTINMNKMELKGLNAFLPPILSEVRGRYEGKVTGELKKSKELKYDISTNIKAFDGELKNLNLASFIMPLLEKIPLIKDKADPEKLKISDRFDKLSLDARATQDYVFLKKFVFNGNKDNMILNAQGKVGMEESKSSRVTAELIVKSIVDDVQKITGQKDLPLLLEGNGFAMLPKVKYTTDKVTERATKTELTKQKKKINKKLKKETKKLEDELKNKAKDLLKGFKL